MFVSCNNETINVAKILNCKRLSISDLFCHSISGSTEELSSQGIVDSTCIVEYGKAVDISYLQYLWDAQTLILHCMKDCRVWSALYDGENPNPFTVIQTLVEEDIKNLDQPIFQLRPRTCSNHRSSHLTSLGDKSQLELEWDDSYDTGISPGSDAGSPQHDADQQPPEQPPKHIQEMKKNAIMLIKGSYIEESDFQDDVMVYRLCAEKDAQEVDSLQEKALNASMSESQNTVNQEQLPTNGPLKSLQLSMDLQQCNMKNANFTEQATPEQICENSVETNPDLELRLSSVEADHNANTKPLSPESENFISQCDNIIKELDTNCSGLVELKLLIPDSISPLEEDEDFGSFSADSPSAESMPSPFGSKDAWSSNPVRIQGVPFTGGIFKS